MKKCATCSLELPLEDFNVNKAKKDGRQANCRICSKSYYKGYYTNSGKEKQRILDKNARMRAELRKFIQSAKNKPCSDCGVHYPYYVMQFDHREPEHKLFHVSTAVSQNMSLEKIKAEIAKCDVVCANCHMERTHGGS